MTDQSAFLTRPKSNEGVKIPLLLPDGTPTEHWIQIRGVDSDAFRLAESKAKRRALDISKIDSQEERDEQIEDARLDLLTSLVIAWSFSQEATAESIKSFLADAPQIARAIDVAAYDRARFFTNGSTIS